MQGADEARQTELMIATPRAYRPDLQLFLQAEGAGTFANSGVQRSRSVSPTSSPRAATTSTRSPVASPVEPQRTHASISSRTTGRRWRRPAPGQRPRRLRRAALRPGRSTPVSARWTSPSRPAWARQYQIDNEHLVDNPANDVLPARDPGAHLGRVPNAPPTSSGARGRDATRERTPDPARIRSLRHPPPQRADGPAAPLAFTDFSDAPMLPHGQPGWQRRDDPQQTTTSRPARRARGSADVESCRGAAGVRLAVPGRRTPTRRFPVDDHRRHGPCVVHGGGWSSIADASAPRCIPASAATSSGAMLKSRSAAGPSQGGAVMNHQGASRSRVTIDGRPMASTAQQRTAPVPGGGGTASTGSGCSRSPTSPTARTSLRIEQDERLPGVPRSDTSRERRHRLPACPQRRHGAPGGTGRSRRQCDD